MQNPNSIVHIVQQDDFKAIFIGNGFFKELMVCNLADILFVLDNIRNDDELLCVLNEIAKRLNSYPDKESCHILLKEILDIFKKNNNSSNVGILISKYISRRTESDSELEKSLDTPLAIDLGNVGFPKELLGDTAAIPAFTFALHEELEIEYIIKQNKVKQITEELQPEEYCPSTIESLHSTLIKIKQRIFNNKKTKKVVDIIKKQ